MSVSMKFGSVALILLAVGTSRAALAQSLDQAPATNARNAQANDGTLPATVESGTPDIVVTGLRASIADAINTKRNSTNIVDSITAQDVGKLPDQNVIDTLSRIPGVQISRSRGDGANYTIRGISQNVTLLNERPFPLGLDAVAADIVASVDVIKSPSADMIEGALGGTVNLKTKRPLDLPDNTFAARGAVQYAEVMDDVGFRGSTLLSKRLFDDRVGILLNVAYQDIRSEQHQFESQGFSLVNSIDGNGDGRPDRELLRIQRLTNSVIPVRRERITGNAAIQIKPSDSLDLLLEATYTKLDAVEDPQRLQVLLNDNAVGAVADENNTIVSGRFNGVLYRPLTYKAEDKSDSLSFGARADWEREGWRVSVDGAYSKGNSPINVGTFTFVIVPRAGLTTSTAFDLTQPGSPSFSTNTNFDVFNPNNYRVDSLSDSMNELNNDTKAFRLDVERDLELGILKSLTVGYRYEDRFEASAQLRGPTALATLRSVFDANRDGIISLDEIPYTPAPSGSFFNGVDGNFPRMWLGGTVDANAAREMLGYERPPVQGSTISQVGEKKHAAYAKLNLDGTVFGIPVRGNVGARYLKIDREVSGFTDAGAGGGLLPVNVNANFEEFLPSATLVAEFGPDLLMRLAAARVVATPALSQLRSGYTFSVVSNQGSGGNPTLRPFQADQIDASLEWYFSPGNLLAGALFYKRVSSFTISQLVETPAPDGYSNPNAAPLPLLISRPTNGNDGKVQGFEVNYQHSFSFLPEPLDGLGIQASYTYADSSAPNNSGTGTRALPSLSRNSFSLTGFYDKGRLEARLAYTYRDKALLSEGLASNGGDTYAAPNDALDGSVQLDMSKNVRLTLDVQNILKTRRLIYNQFENRVNSFTIDDRRWYLGIAASF